MNRTPDDEPRKPARAAPKPVDARPHPDRSRSGPRKPRSVRDLPGAPEPALPAGTEQPEAVTIDIRGEPWTIRAMGQAEGPRGTGQTTLLLLRFTRGTEESDLDDDEDTEAWVVGHELAELAIDRLVEALDGGRPWKNAGGTRPFFDDIGGQRRR